MLGIGSTELVLILFFGFLIFGPEKLPQMGSVVGKAIKQFRQASDDVNKKFKEEIYDPFQEVIDPYKSEIEESVAPLKEDLSSINKTFRETEQMFRDPLDLKGKSQQLKTPLQAAREADKVTSTEGVTTKKITLSDEAKQAAADMREQAAAMAADDALADPFAEPTPAPEPAAAEASKPSMAASLYGLDGAEGGDE